MIRLCCALAALLLLSGCVTFELGENHFFHPGPAREGTSIEVPGAQVEALQLRTADGVTLAGAAITSADADAVVVYFGGNASHIDEYAGWLAAELLPLRANLLVFDYRGYGRSSGSPTVATLRSDALAVFDEARKRFPGRPVILHGLSLGGFIAAHVAAHRRPDGLVLESTAPDVRRWAQSQVPAYAKPFVRLRIAPALIEESNVRALQQYAGPLLILTGSADRVTPPRLSTALLEAARSTEKRLIIVPNAMHGTVMESEVARREYAAFLASIRRSRGTP